MLYFINKVSSNNRIQATILLIVSCVIVLSLITYSPSDPSFNLVTLKYPANLLSYFGAYIADLLYQFCGISSFILPICCFSWSINLYKNTTRLWLSARIILILLAIIFTAGVFGPLKFKNLPAGGGGAFGLLITSFVQQYGGKLNNYWWGLHIAAFILFILAAEIQFKFFFNFLINIVSRLRQILVIKTPIFWFKNTSPIKANFIRKAPALNHNEIDQQQPSIPIVPNQPKPSFFKRQTEIKSIKPVNEEISSLPSIELLKQADNPNIKIETPAELKQNSEKLLTVLGDFGVKGQIINISQGPVVTLYEFEPAAGTKSSRVIGLSDDIARSLSAISTRIAVIPGRNVLGIELPNKQRAFFCLRELIETPEYQDNSIMLPLILGKDLAGKPYIADLAKMPHLLVAGTTGSGKSVAINAMIISLLYRYTPQDCRLIMIDPKMLELSAYDGIPHLLTPVVTEPGKAVVALKWAVKEMENRYRSMSNIGVRNIAGYNAKILEASKENKVLERTVQTGFDHETGKPIYETVTMNMEKLPLIVVIVDEMADLMLVAGKDIELSIQRLAQMARAAGIHIIMATQRPSVDVITGVIKANFPSRISFKVTSKIDSRTILGEQGSEQLLGMGDMLYMGNSSKITRVHGPFVDDKEVEKITEYLRSTGTPEYLTAVTEQSDDEILVNNDTDENTTNDEALYKRAVQIIQLERKVSISYIQRCLRIGYNRAANLIDKMEENGLISPPSHSGKREILLPED